MDALKRDAAILRALLLTRFSITILLVLVAFMGLLLSVISEEKRVDAFLGCMLFATVCLLAPAAGRVRTYCESAGPLGIPRHALAMRRAQYILIGLFTLVPIGLALSLGADLRAVVIFVGGTAFAIYLTEALNLMVVAVFALKGLAAAGVDTWAFIFGIPGTVVILSASAWGMVRWLRLPLRLEAEAAATSLALSDPAHEDVHADELDAANEAFERHLDDVLAPRALHKLASRRLWIGLGFDPVGNWRANAWGLALALAAVSIFHFWKHSRWDLGGYMALSAFFATYVFGRFQRMNEAWLQTHGEQSLLILSARWPSRGKFKIVLLRSVWTGIPELLAGWLLFSGAELALGWVEWRTVALAALGHVAVLVSSLGIFLSYLAHSRLRKTNLLPMAYLLTALAGTATLLTSMANGHMTGTLVGAALLLAPAAVTFLAFFLRPLLFPVQIDARQ